MESQTASTYAMFLLYPVVVERLEWRMNKFLLKRVIIRRVKGKLTSG